MTKHHILAGRMHVCMRSNGALGDIVFKGARAEGPLTYEWERGTGRYVTLITPVMYPFDGRSPSPYILIE